jgi:formylglycine-generating enzyme required for sulfatase activity
MRTFHSLPLLLGASLSQAFSLAGTVYRQGTVVPLPGATVTTTSHSELVSTTDAQGRFVLTNETSGIATRRASPWTLAWQNDGFVLRTGDLANAELDILSPEGRHLEHLSATTISGNAVFRPSREATRGLRVVRIRQGGRTQAWTMLSLPNTGKPTLTATPSFAGRGLEVAADTLVVSKPGMTQVRSPLPAGAGELLATLTDPVTMMPLTMGKMRFIPEGTFRMGDPTMTESSPTIKRTVRAFWMDTIPVSDIEAQTLGFPQFRQTGVPAELNWVQSVRYCNARSLADGLEPAYILSQDSGFWSAKPNASGYRLPTEAEWEYAARAGTTTAWHWGDDSSTQTISVYAQYTGNTQGYPLAGGLLAPNGFGLRDMAGNSWEWTDDFYGPYVADETQPVGQKSEYGYKRVFRGGSWFTFANQLRSGYRGFDYILKPDYIGARCVRTAFPDTTPPAWKRFPTSLGQRRVPGGTVRMGDSAQTEALPFNERNVRELWVDTALVSAVEFVKTTGMQAFVDSTRPVDIMWYQAVRYCNARSAKDGLTPAYSLEGDSTAWAADTAKDGYRLPSEAEWEYLARAGSTSAWWWGDDSTVNSMAPRAWWLGNATGFSQPTGQKLPNPFGLYDMVGNVRQWTDDLYGPYKADGSLPTPAMQTYGYHRVYRGGAWFAGAATLRSGWRMHDMGLASGYIGFRCVRNAR